MQAFDDFLLMLVREKLHTRSYATIKVAEKMIKSTASLKRKRKSSAKQQKKIT
jgi:hypothetical protein